MNNSECFISVDVGTTHTKGALIDIHGKKLAAHAIRHVVLSPEPGWAEHDMEKSWWLDATDIIKQLLSVSGVDKSSVKSVIVSGMDPSLGLTDEFGNPLRNGITQSDIRIPVHTVEDFGLKSWDHIKKNTYILPRLLWVKENEPDVYSRIRKVFFAHSYLFYRLTGQYSIDFNTPCWITPLYNASNRSYDRSAFDALGLTNCALPEVYGPIEAVGQISKEASEITGLSCSTKVMVGTGDFYLSNMAAGLRDSGDALLYYGSVGIILVCIEPITTFLSKPTMEGMPGDPLGMGPIFPVSGILLEWFRDNLAKKEAAEAKKAGKSIFALLDAAAAKVQIGSERLLLLPHFYGERNPDKDPEARGVLYGLSMNHGVPEIYRSILESFGYSMRHGLEVMEAQGEDMHIQHLFASGGGAASPFWRQMMTNILGLPQSYYKGGDETLAGAYLAAMGVGYFNDVDIFYNNWLGKSEDTVLQPTEQLLYDRSFAAYKHIYSALKSTYKILRTINT